MEKVLFVREKVAQKEFAELKQHFEKIKASYDYLTKAVKGIDITISMGNIVAHSLIVQQYREIEIAKVKPLIEQFGADNVVLQDWESKVNAKVRDFEGILKSCPIIGTPACEYLQYVEITADSGIIAISPEYDIDYFRRKYSVILKEEKDFEFYEKHKQACQLLNELTDHPENEFEALTRLFYFNPDTKEFEMDIAAYCPDVHLKIL
jgi:hypothetical protein